MHFHTLIYKKNPYRLNLPFTFDPYDSFENNHYQYGETDGVMVWR